uniref:Uncharacterized protein n=1 Tax=Romanomermis culicivorax TaxID=13658 RepID=A0A915KTR2_ROMCU
MEDRRDLVVPNNASTAGFPTGRLGHVAPEFQTPYFAPLYPTGDFTTVNTGDPYCHTNQLQAQQLQYGGFQRPDDLHVRLPAAMAYGNQRAAAEYRSIIHAGAHHHGAMVAAPTDAILQSLHQQVMDNTSTDYGMDNVMNEPTGVIRK